MNNKKQQEPDLSNNFTCIGYGFVYFMLPTLIPIGLHNLFGFPTSEHIMTMAIVLYFLGVLHFCYRSMNR